MARTIWSKVNGRKRTHSIKTLFIYDVVYGFSDKFAFEIGFDWHFVYAKIAWPIFTIHKAKWQNVTASVRTRSYIQCTMYTIGCLKTIPTTDKQLASADVLIQTPTQSKSTIDINMDLLAEHIMHWHKHELNMSNEWQTLGNALSESVVVLSPFVAA